MPFVPDAFQQSPGLEHVESPGLDRVCGIVPYVFWRTIRYAKGPPGFSPIYADAGGTITGKEAEQNALRRYHGRRIVFEQHNYGNSSSAYDSELTFSWDNSATRTVEDSQDAYTLRPTTTGGCVQSRNSSYTDYGFPIGRLMTDDAPVLDPRTPTLFDDHTQLRDYSEPSYTTWTKGLTSASMVSVYTNINPTPGYPGTLGYDEYHENITVTETRLNEFDYVAEVAAAKARVLEESFDALWTGGLDKQISFHRWDWNDGGSINPVSTTVDSSVDGTEYSFTGSAGSGVAGAVRDILAFYAGYNGTAKWERLQFQCAVPMDYGVIEIFPQGDDGNASYRVLTELAHVDAMQIVEATSPTCTGSMTLYDYGTGKAPVSASQVLVVFGISASGYAQKLGLTREIPL